MVFRLTPLFDLTGRTALVTGGNSSIGLAMARALGLAGAKVALVARRATELEAAAAALQDEGISAVPIAADLALEDAAEIVETSTQAHDLAVDIDVNAAGLNLRQPFFKDTARRGIRPAYAALHLRAPFLRDADLRESHCPPGLGAHRQHRIDAKLACVFRISRCSYGAA